MNRVDRTPTAAPTAPTDTCVDEIIGVGMTEGSGIMRITGELELDECACACECECECECAAV